MVGLCFTQGHADRRDIGCERCGGTAVGLDAEGRGKSLAARPRCQLDAPGTQPAFVFRLQASYWHRSRFGPDPQPLLTPAKTYESEVADALVIGDERAVYADKAYEKKERRAALKARGVKDRIQHRRHKYIARLPHWQSVRNRLIGRIRGGVERTFVMLKRVYGLDRMRYRGLAANRLHVDLIAIAFNLRRAAAGLT